MTAPWAGPSRPAPTVLRELSRRWGDARPAVLVEDPAEETLDAWSIEVLPTWLLLERDERSGSDAEAGPLGSRTVRGATPAGEPLVLEGLWREVRRLTGAHPKHVIDAEFGPGL
ncbi:hypothetical protein ACT3SP_01785 [Brachybacterium sp. AOP43-C2-M15]|uniref:hypothetical protein n=1 Tax=Brachybacterium sp. AOP43-C2-M15 TaxID=3457661 RepID=UPI004034955F